MAASFKSFRAAHAETVHPALRRNGVVPRTGYDPDLFGLRRGSISGRRFQSVFF